LSEGRKETENDLDVHGYDVLAKHPRIADFTRIARCLMDERPADRGARVAELAEAAGLSSEDAQTPLGNVLEALRRPAAEGRERALVAALAAHALMAAAVKDGSSGPSADLLDLGAPTLVRALRGRAVPWLRGELTAPPRGRTASLLLAVTGIALVARAVRLLGRLLLAYRRPAEIVVAEDGSVRLRWRQELLGRVLVDREFLVPKAALRSALRDVRYPRMALEAGLLALAAGSYVGVSACVDGVRAGSVSLLAVGFGIAGLGLAADFVLSVVVPGARGTCRVLLTTREGQRFCIGGVAIPQADAFLERLRKNFAQ
jgi:hypothetical protein